MKKHFLAAMLCLVMVLSLCTGFTVAEASGIPPDEVSSFDPNKDYMALMIQCAKTNTDESMRQGAVYEAQRNLKIFNSENSIYEQTNYFVNTDGLAVLTQIFKNEFTYDKCYTENDVYMLARVMFCESRGIKSLTEISCVGWTILNRVDSDRFTGNTIAAVITAPNQFAYSPYGSTTSDYGYDLLELARDILDRWSMEKAGMTDVGRTLPSDYFYYSGDGAHNYFRTQYRGGVRWDYSLPTPYES